jgi:hypothetical protein
MLGGLTSKTFTVGHSSAVPANSKINGSARQKYNKKMHLPVFFYGEMVIL